ncbi:MAG: hypothetical protein WD969_14630 [Paracoccaceae bacterium]
MTDFDQRLAVIMPAWKELKTEEKEEILYFPVLWSIFELRATGRNGQQPNANPRAICKAVADLPAPLVLNDELLDARKYFAGWYFDNGTETTAWTALRVDSAFKARVKCGLSAKEVDDRKILTALLLVVNRLRNNLLHGTKARYGFIGQYKNFHHASKVLNGAIMFWPPP